ncbi:hypothetical protein TrCOL_g11329 [Triparma columacea]|uniref:Uncharacterized protein n=1 Tax=Triparma columacea TaxID=722753 RepID=A0A9W7GE86_9STRA|nr:hypothetical protein TrCOL_g11329 [Triparma columacea]
MNSFIYVFFFLALISGVAQAGEIEAKLIFKALLKLSGINDVDVDSCFSFAESTEQKFKDFSSDIASKQYSQAMIDLNGALSGLQTSIHDCGVEEIETKLSSIATALKLAKVSEALDEAMEIVIDATDVSEHISALAVDVAAGDAIKVADDIDAMMEDWSKIDCTTDSCNVVDGFLKILQIVSHDISGACVSDLETAFSTFETGVNAFENKNYTAALSEFATGFDDVAKVLETTECGLPTIAKIIAPIAPKISEAVINGDSIIIEVSEVYDDIYQAVLALQRHDYNAFGMEIGKLVTVINTAGCKTAACKILVGLLESAELVAVDYSTCLEAVDATGDDFEQAIAAFESKDYKTGISKIGTTLKSISDDITSCDVKEFADILSSMAGALGADDLVKEIGAVVAVIVAGQDITNEIDMAVSDYKNGDFKAFGKDLGDIAHVLEDELHCNKFVCKILEGILEEAEIVLTNFKQCEDSLEEAEQDFVAGFTAFKSGDKKAGVEDISKGIRQIGEALGDCGLEDELAFLEHEANVFGLSNVTALNKAEEAVAILIHGFNFYDNVADMVADVEKHDYRAAGHEIQVIMDDLSKWSTGHVCQNTWCYVVEGIMEAEAIIEGDVRQCEQDFENAWGEFSAAVALFNTQVSLAEELSGEIKRKLMEGEIVGDDIEALKVQMSHKIADAVKDIGKGLEDVAAGIHDCHLEELADLLTKLAAELAVPEVSWIAEVLHIVVHGAEIVEDVGLACEDFGDENWVKFGFDLAKLVKVLI